MACCLASGSGSIQPAGCASPITGTCRWFAHTASQLSAMLGWGKSSGVIPSEVCHPDTPVPAPWHRRSAGTACMYWKRSRC